MRARFAMDQWRGEGTLLRRIRWSLVGTLVQSSGRAGREVPLPGGDISSLAATQAECVAETGDDKLSTHLTMNYGGDWRSVLATVRGSPELAFIM